jgi:hypothetical protein
MKKHADFWQVNRDALDYALDKPVCPAAGTAAVPTGG